jgi:peptidoglycan/LPS O-acetylase OafA/YrhL
LRAPRPSADSGATPDFAAPPAPVTPAAHPQPLTYAHDGSGHYQPDIDGLRALAVIPVMLFHYRLGHVPGGFVGVDIFFVISGYLITSVLLRDIRMARFSLVRFYERRVRRILPALFFMLALVALAAPFVLLPGDLVNFGKSVLATTAFVSNFYFWTQSGYFNRAAEFAVLLHTWSLAVEEQFYILFPLCLYFVTRLRRTYMLAALTLLALGSLAAGILLSYQHASVAFYWPISRAWELLLGALLAVGALPIVRASWLRHALSLGGLLLILASFVLIDSTQPFPGWVALAPCLGAALLIYANLCGGGAGNRLLALRPLTFIGLISYSLYLWHWPLLVLARGVVPLEPTRTQLALLLVLVFLIATFSWWYVERPFRSGAQRFSARQVFRFAALASGAAAIGGAALCLDEGWAWRFPAFRPEVTASANAIYPQCFSRGSARARREDLCLIGSGGGPASFILWGDSHAQRWALPVAETATDRARRGYLASAGSCPPLIGVGWPLHDCLAFNEEIVRLIDRHPEVSPVILAGLWADYAEGTHYRSDEGYGSFNPLTDLQSPGELASDNQRVFARALERTVTHFTAEGRRVLVIGPVPEIRYPVPETLFKMARFGGSRPFGPTRAEFDSRQGGVLAALAAVARLPGVTVVYPADLLCADACAVERAGVPLYIDDNHLSTTGLELVRPLLAPAFH